MDKLWVTNYVAEEDEFDEACRVFFAYVPGSDVTGYDIWTDERKQAWKQENWHEIDEADVPTEPQADEYANTEPEE